MVSILHDGQKPVSLTITRAEFSRLDEFLASILDDQPEGAEIEVISLDGWPEAS